MKKSYKLYHGEAEEVLDKLPPCSVDCCVTSPPYWNLRCYGTEDQIGKEKYPEQYVQRITEVFWSVMGVLKNTGTCWVVINDSYQNKQLVGIPWLFAARMQEEGWLWRSTVVWYKRVCLTESVKDRPSVCHEYVLMFTKSPKYYYDARAIFEPYSPETIKQINSVYMGQTKNTSEGTKAQNPSDTKRRIIEGLAKRGGRNKRSVWEVNRVVPKGGTHTAAYPEELILPCILAGCPERGIVLDPFVGSGTTAVVALKNNRRAVGIDSNAEYIEQARKRIESI